MRLDVEQDLVVRQSRKPYISMTIMFSALEAFFVTVLLLQHRYDPAVWYIVPLMWLLVVGFIWLGSCQIILDNSGITQVPRLIGRKRHLNYQDIDSIKGEMQFYPYFYRLMKIYGTIDKIKPIIVNVAVYREPDLRLIVKRIVENKGSVFLDDWTKTLAQ
jgi:hypothetical protein